MNIGSRRGVWGNRVSPRPRPAGEWGNPVSPFPHPREGLGGLRPPKNKLIFIAALCGGAAWTADVKISPRRGGGETGFPHTSADAGRRPAHPGPTPWEGLGGRSPPRNNRMFIAALCGAAAWTPDVNMGEPGSPIPPPAGGKVRAQPLRRGMGQPGCPTSPPAGGKVRAQPLRRGMGQPGCPTSPPAGGPGPPAGVGGNRVSPHLRPREGLGRRSPPRKDVHPVGVRRKPHGWLT